jgi:hypothetical protein
MYVEDFIEAIEAKISTSNRRLHKNIIAPFGNLFNSEWHRSFIENVTQHTRAGRPLSSNQSRMILKMINAAQAYLVDYDIANQAIITEILEFPKHRQPPYESSNVPREVRYLGDNLLGIRCKANEILTNAIKHLGKINSDPLLMPNILRSVPRFDWGYRIWIVPVHRHNLFMIFDLLSEFRIQPDQATNDYLALCRTSIGKESEFVFADDQQQALRALVCDDYILASWITEIAGGVVL